MHSSIVGKNNSGCDGFEGTLSNIQLIDLIQMTCLSKISIDIKVYAEDKEGIIQIFKGNVVHSQTDNKSGEEAFFDIMSWQGGSFETASMKGIPTPSIVKNWEFLLIEATKFKDEVQEQEKLIDSIEKPTYESSENQIKVLIVDDSRIICERMTEILEKDPGIKIVGTARNGKDALKKLRELEPDLVTLDINMPVMSGDTALKHIMISSPCPIVIVSGMESENMTPVFDYLRLGAIDFVSKPRDNRELEKKGLVLIEKIKVAAKARVKNFKRGKLKTKKEGKIPEANPLGKGDRIVILIAGVGGYAEWLKIIPALPQVPGYGVLALQDMNTEFIRAFTGYLQQYSSFGIVPIESCETTIARTGTCHFASLSSSISLRTIGDDLRLKFGQNSGIWDEVLSGLVMSAVKSLWWLGDIVWIFLSGEKRISRRIVGQIKKSGSVLIIQHPESSLQPALPSSCMETGLVDFVLPAELIPGKLGEILVN